MTPFLSAKVMHSRSQNMKLCCELRTHLYRHAGNRVSSLYCVKLWGGRKTWLHVEWSLL